MGLSTEFADFYLATRQHSISDLKSLPNQATKYRTYLIREIMRGLTKDEYVQSGTEIVDFIQLTAPTNFQQYNPSDNFSFSPSNHLTKIKVPWRFNLVDTNWVDHEIILNSGSKEEVFKRVRKIKDQSTETAFWEGMEAQLWDTPNKVEMEDDNAGNGRKPLSLRCFVTDDGLAPSSTNGGVVGSNWTTIQTVNPTTYSNYRNQVETYDASSTINRAATLIGAFDAMWIDVQFMAPTNDQTYFQDTKLSKMKILASKTGLLLLQSIVRANNDRLVPVNDFGYTAGKVTYAGMQIMHIDTLRDVDATPEALSVPAPRYRFLNFDDFRPIFHSDRFQFLKEIKPAANSPFTNLIVRDTWMNILCKNRRNQGMIRAA